MEYNWIIGFVLCFVVYACGVVMGYWLHRQAHKDGVKLMDRLKEGREPYDEEIDNTKAQMVTGGEFQEV